MYIKNNDIVIRNAEVSDAEILCKWWNDGQIMSHAGFPNGLGTNVLSIQESLLNDSDEKARRLMIEYMDMAIGEMSYRNLGNGTVEIGIKICDASHREKGLGTKILNLYIRSLFNEYDKIVLDTNLKNTRAQHVYEKLGFTKLRVNHNAWKNQLGDLESSVDYELTKEDFIC